MSGGIDSTVTAMILHEQGYEVVGITMKTWDYANSGGSKKETGCCSLDSINDARAVSVQMGFHHFIVDIREDFGDFVIDNFVDEYMAGRTPNPCVLCNTHIKWNSLVKRADAMDCEFIATGHYGQLFWEDDAHQQRINLNDIRSGAAGEGGRYFVSKAADDNKDQSYVLWGLSQECMERSRFPLGHMTKPEVRQLAYDFGHEELSKKAESFEICFVPDNDYRGFLKRRDPEMEARLANGAFVDQQGKQIGTHNGFPFYTIGQRRNLGMAFGKPMFVTEIKPETNTVVLGEVDDLVRNGMIVGGVNFQKYAGIPAEGREALTKVRYKDSGTLSMLSSEVPGQVTTEFYANVRGVAPGQSAVFYDGGDLIGGGIIHSSSK
jgi:tRNA-specific 2-thiouridylase